MKQFLYIYMLLFSSSIIAQVYVGETKLRNSYQYMKLEVKEDSSIISFPYVSRRTFKLPIEPKPGNELVVDIALDKIRFSVNINDENSIHLIHEQNGIQQNTKLVRQLDPIKSIDFAKYSGSYKDQFGNILIIYVRNGYLHMMSPFTEQTVSLKPIGKHIFWSVTGESTHFHKINEDCFQMLSISDRNGNNYELEKSFGYKIHEDWVHVDGDSIHIKIYIPEIPGKKAACLLLPGGGGMSQIENAAYEARLFASHGLVSLVFDKSGVGKSIGQNFENFTFQEKARRYQKLYSHLKSHEEVDANKVGIHGPSEGGRLALLMGINLGAEIAFINAVAAPVMSLEEGQLYAVNHYSRNIGMSENDIITTLGIWQNYYTGIINESIDTTHYEPVRVLQNKYPNPFLPPMSDRIPLSPNKEDLADSIILTKASMIKSPVLLQYGENDKRVDPVMSVQNFYRYAADDLPVKVKFYERGNHSMMTPEYEICPGYAYDKIKWIKSIGILDGL